MSEQTPNIRIRTIFEHIDISVVPIKFSPSIKYSDLIEKINSINEELRKVEQIRDLLKIIRDNYDILKPVVEVIITSYGSGISITNHLFQDTLKISVANKLAKEIKHYEEKGTLDDVEKALEKLETILREEKKKTLEFVKELSKRNLLKIEIETDDEEEERDEEEDC